MAEDVKEKLLAQQNLQREILQMEIPVFITKSNFFRVVHVDGVFGGGTPSPGTVMMTAYSHRIAFPKKTSSDVLGNEIQSKRDPQVGVEQEYEVSLVMSIEVAQQMLSWLDNTIKNVQSVQQSKQ